MNIKKLLLAAGLTLSAASAQSATYDFIDAIDGAGGPINESIWTEFDTGDFAYFTGPSISLTGTSGGNAAYAYADAGTAGFGVCRTPLTPATGTYVDLAKPGKSNVCDPGSDDSIQSAFEELLKITANEAGTRISSITVNANHDGKLMEGDKVKINGVEITLTAADIVGGYYTHTVDRVFGIGDFLTVESVGGASGPHLYLSGMEVSAVPVPAALPLLLAGLGGLGFMGRRRRKAA